MIKIVRCSDFSKSTLFDISYKIADLIIISSQELFEVLLGDKAKSVIRDLFLDRGNLYSYENTWVALKGDEVAGMMVLFPQSSLFKQGLKMGLKVMCSMKLRVITRIYSLLRAESLILPIPKNTIYLSNIAVFPSYRRIGVGRQMLKYISDYAKSLNYDRVILDVGVENEVALRLYKSEGFEVVAKTKSFKIDTYTFCFYRMEKKVGNS